VFSSVGGVKIGFNAAGGISSLIGPAGVQWAGPANPLVQLWYNSYDGAFFDTFVADYAAGAHPNNKNFGKPGLANDTTIRPLDAAPVLQVLLKHSWHTRVRAVA
jgi:hypothetical protein